MVRLPPELIEIFNDPETNKILATLDEQGNPHVVCKYSLTILDDGTIGFLELIETSQTHKNMLRSYNFKKPVAINITNVKRDISYQIKGHTLKLTVDGLTWDRFLDQIWSVMPDVNPAGVWLIEPDEVIDENFQVRRKEEDERFFPRASFWHKYSGQRLPKNEKESGEA